MPTVLPTQQDLYDIIKTEIQSRRSDLTDFEEGSINDAIAGATSVLGQELVKLVVEKFNKTYIETAEGAEATGDTDDLEFLAKDHFGEGFARSTGSPATGTVTFSRPTTAAGSVTIPKDTVVKTEKDANGEEQRFLTESEVILTGLTISASVNAAVNGTEGNVAANKVTVIESSLTDDTITVDNALAFAGGAGALSDADYREFIRNKVEEIRGATKAAVESAALNVSGVVTATAIEDILSVREVNPADGVPVTPLNIFNIVRTRLFIADVNGTASQALIDNVIEAVFGVKACGVTKQVIAASPLSVDWDATVTLNPSGPNFASLSLDLQPILDSMSQYIRDLDIGTGFNRDLARAAILAIWGPSGSDDITTFTTNSPTGEIAATATDKLIPGTISAS